MTGPEAHHELGASGAHRWLICPGSVPAQRGKADKSSVYAEEGTSAHELAEAFFNFWKKAPGSTRAIQDWRKAAEAAGYDANEMARETEKYLEYVRDLCGGNPDRLRVEVRVEFGDLIPGGFGTVDAQVITLDELEETVERIDIGDLKYGKGKRVDAVGNVQMRLYAYGTLVGLMGEGLIDPEFDDFDSIPVGLHICQPRLEHFDDETITAQDVLDWAETVASPAVKRIDDGDLTRVPGDGCTFCKAAATCKAKAEKHAADLETDFDDFVEDGPEAPNVDELTPEQIGKLLAHKKDVENWFESLKAHVYNAIESGEDVPGWKLVAGNRSKAYTGTVEEMFEAFKKQRALKQDEYAPRKLLTPAQALKVLPEKSSIRDLIIQKDGKPVLADEASKKPALTFAKITDDFDDEGDI